MNQKAIGRIEVVDALRGIALFAIVVLHCFEHYNLYCIPQDSPQWLTALDRGVWDTTWFLMAGKAFSTFSLLFGLSFFIQHDNQAQKGVDFRPRFLWRMVLLMLFGLFDLLFYNGDILFIYAVCGVLIIPLIRASDKVIWAFIILMLMQPVELVYLILGLIDPSTPMMDLGSAACYNAIIPAQSEGSILDVAVAGIRYGLPANILWAIENGRMTQTILFFLFGIMLGRRRLFYDEGNNVKIWKKIFFGSMVAFAVLLPLYIYIPKAVAIPCVSNCLNVALNMWKNISMMLFIVSCTTLLYYRTSARRWLIRIAPYGKMSLTNYLGQSIIGAAIFYNWGLGLFRHFGHTADFFLAIAFVALQFLFCTWWMKHHKRGPLEQLWCTATWFGKKK